MHHIHGVLWGCEPRTPEPCRGYASDRGSGWDDERGGLGFETVVDRNRSIGVNAAKNPLPCRSPEVVGAEQTLPYRVARDENPSTQCCWDVTWPWHGTTLTEWTSFRIRERVSCG